MMKKIFIAAFPIFQYLKTDAQNVGIGAAITELRKMITEKK